MSFLMWKKELANRLIRRDCQLQLEESPLNPTPPQATPPDSTSSIAPENDGDGAVVDLRELFEREESNLLRYAYSLTGRRAIAEEIVQQVFLLLHARWSQVESPAAWLYRCVRNHAFHHLRQSKREVLQGDTVDTQPTSDRQDEPPDATIQRLESTAVLRGLVEKLPQRDRELVRLKYFEGLRYREIAEQTGMSISNVGFRLHQIMHRLATELNPLGIDDLS